MSHEQEVKKLLDEQMVVFKQFQEANDRMQGEIKKQGEASALTAETVKRINEELDRVGGLVKEIGLKQNRAGFNGMEMDPDKAEYKKAFGQYLRKGQDNGLDELQAKAMSVGVDSDGGYLVTPDSSGRIAKKLFDLSPIRQIASVQVISTDALEGLTDNDEVSYGWTSETGTRTETNTATLAKYRIPVHELYVKPKATQQLLDDAAVDVDAWLNGKIADKIARVEGGAFVTADGVGKPRGFASYPTAATADSTRSWGTLEHVATGSAGAFGTAPNGSDKLVDLVHKLKAGYRAGSVFIMNKVTLGAVRQLKANGEYIWLPSMDAAAPSRLLGFPVVEAEDMATYTTTDALAIAFGNFGVGYQIVDRQNIRVLRDPFSSKPFIEFYTTYRVGGAVVNSEAIKFLKFGTS